MAALAVLTGAASTRHVVPEQVAPPTIPLERWQSANKVKDIGSFFIVADGSEERADRTQAYLVYGNGHLFVAIHCNERRMSNAVATAVGDVESADYVAVGLTVENKRSQTVIFMVAPNGARHIEATDAALRQTKWQAEAQSVPGGWDAVLSIDDAVARQLARTALNFRYWPTGSGAVDV